MDAKIVWLKFGEMGFLHNMKVSSHRILIKDKEKKYQGHERQMKIKKLPQIKESKKSW